MADVMKDVDDNEGERLAEDRVAPTRKRNYLIVDSEKQDKRDSPSSCSRSNDDENAEEMLRSVTGYYKLMADAMKDDDDGEILLYPCAAPTRKRNYLKPTYKKKDTCDSSSRTSKTKKDKHTKVLRSVTSKWFSFTKLFKKKETPEAKSEEQVDESKTESEEKQNERILLH